MSKIDNYDNDIDIRIDDKVVGTDAQDSKKTKNYTFKKIFDFMVDYGFQINYFNDPTKEDIANKVSTVVGNETDETKYPNTKALKDGMIAAVSESNDYTDSIFNGTAVDADVVHLDGIETITGTKTFTQLVTASGFKIPLGDASGFLKADGSVDHSPYVTGNGIANYLPKWGTPTSFTNSIITDDSSGVTINGARPIQIMPNGSAPGTILIKGDPAGWELLYGYKGSGNTTLGGFGSVGQTDTLFNYYIGASYLNPSMVIKSNVGNTGNVLIGSVSDNNTDKLQVNGSLLSTAYKKVGGTSSQFLKADGSVDSTVYLPASTYNDRFKGKYLTLVALQSAHPTSNDGDYAIVDPGAGVHAQEYVWDSQDGWVITGTDFSASTTDALAEGSTNLYFTENRVRATILTGLSLASNAIINATDSIVSAFGKLQKQISERALDTAVIHTTGNETKSGNLTLTNPLTIGTTQLTENIMSIEAMDMSTGLYSFAGITITSGTTFSVGAAQGYVVDTTVITKPVPIAVNYAGATGLTTPYIGTAPATYLSLNSSGTLVMSNVEPTESFYRDNIVLGVIGHPSGTLTGIGNKADVMFDTADQFRDMFRPMRLINDGIVFSANSTNLTVANTSGKLYGLGIGFVANGKNNPTTLAVSPGTPTTFQYRTQTGVSTANTTNIIPGSYDVAGTVTAVGGGANSATNQRMYLLENGNFRFQYGQTVYATLAAAVAAAQTESFTVFSNNKLLGVLVGILSVNKNATDLSNPAQAQFLRVSKFGETVGAAAGITTATRQSSYNNSATPQTVVSDTLGADTWKNGRSLDTSKVMAWQNIAGTETASITGNGDFSANKYIKPGGTSTQYLMADGSVKTEGQIVKTRKDISGTTYNLLSSDVDKILYTTNASPVVITIPTGLTSGQEYEIFQYAVGQVSYVVSGTTLVYDSYEQPKHEEINTRVFVTWIDTEKYKLHGELSAY